MESKGRALVAAGLTVAALALLAAGVPATLTALRAQRAVISACGSGLSALRSGTWVRLRGCGVDMFHASFLDDVAGKRAHRLAPLRTPGGSATEPSGLALAIPAALVADPNVFRNTPRPDSAGSQIADLGETTGVVWDTLDRLPYHLVQVPGVDHGLAPVALVIEIRQAPPLGRSGASVVFALIGIALAIAVFRGKSSEHVPGPSARAAPSAPGVRWGLVFVTVLVGLVALWNGLGWYFDPARQTDRAIAAPPAPTAPPNEARDPARPALPEPTREEVALLASRDPANQLRGIEALRTRAVTTDAMAAVDSALQRDPAPAIEAGLVCLKSRFEGPGSLEFLLARLPTRQEELAWNLKPEVSCVLNALVRRATEAPERVRAALMPAVYSSNLSVREGALAAFRMMDLPQIPAMLVAEASTSGAPYQREALSAALALGAVRLNPALIAGAIRDPYTSPVVREELRTSPHPNAARIVANVWAQRSGEGEYEHLARDREGQLHDVSAALLEIVLDPSVTEDTRATAAHHLEVLADVGPLHDLRELSPTLESGRLKTSVEATVGALEERLKGGDKPQMRALPR